MHPSDLVWSRFLSNELRWLERWRFGRHLSACAACTQKRDELALERTAFEADHERAGDFARLVARAGPRLLPLEREPAKPGWSMWLVAPACAAIAAGAFGVIRFMDHRDDGPVAAVDLPRDERDVLTPKGADWFVVYRRTADGAEPLQDAKCQAGDALRGRYQSGRGYVFIVEADARGQVTALFPEEGGQSAAAPPERSETPGSWVLDEVPGRERFIAVFSDKALTFAEIEAAIANAKGKKPVIAGANVVEVDCEKARP